MMGGDGDRENETAPGQCQSQRCAAAVEGRRTGGTLVPFHTFHTHTPSLPPLPHLVIPPQAAYVDGEQGADRYAPSRTRCSSSGGSSCGCPDL